MFERFRVRLTPPEKWDPVLELLLRRLPPQYRHHRKESIRRRLRGVDGIPLELWHVETASLSQGHGVPEVAAGIVEFQPGHVAMARAPSVLSHRFRPAGVQLLRTWREILPSRNCRVLQVVAEDPSVFSRRMLREAGLVRITSLLYMAWEPPPGQSPPLSAALPPELRLEPFQDISSFWERLSAVVRRTYLASLDCPEVSEVRSVEDTLLGYRLSAKWEPWLWFILRLKEEDIGCLLLADRPEEQSVELVYMGLAPEYRGRGWSKPLIAEAQRQATALGRSHLVLAADVRNWPALCAYEQAGFHSVARADLFQKILA